MSFYPRLYEKELTQSQFEKALGKFLMASPEGNILVDPNTRKIIHVNKKRGEDPITWDDVPFTKSGKKEIINNKNKDLIDFLKKNTGLDVMKILNDIKTNQLKKKNKTFTPIEIPPIPKDITWRDFWVSQLKKYDDEVKKALSHVEDTKQQSGTSKKDIAFDTEYNIPASLNNFFINETKKGEEWKEFLKNSTSGKGMSVIGEMNAFFELLNEVVEGDIKRNKYKFGKGYANVALNTPEQVQEWKDDMVEYIGKYSTDTIKNVNNDGTYQKMISKGNKPLGFLAALMNLEPSGMGRGEILIAYIMKGAKFAGGSESFDIQAEKAGNIPDDPKADIIAEKNGKNVTYELKDYSPSTTGSIRLGNHGGLGRFKWWKEIEKTVNLTRQIKEEIGEDKLRKILGNEAFMDLWNFVSSYKPYQETREIGSGVEAGEVNVNKIEYLKNFYALTHELLNKETENKEKDQYTYAILKGKGLKSKLVKINPVNKDAEIKNIEVNSSEDDLVKFKELEDIKYVKDPLQLQKDLDKIGEHYAETSNVDYFMVFLKNELDIEPLENYVFDTISQKSVKIKNVKRRGSMEQIPDKAFKIWKENKDKDYYQIFKKIYAKEKGNYDIDNITESYYPRLFK